MRKLLILILFMPLQAMAIDKIFMSKSERNMLDNMRSSAKFKKNEVDQYDNNLRLGGVVIKSGKKSVVFINGKNTRVSRNINQSLHVHTKNIKSLKPRVLVTKDKVSRYMKPGQVWLSSKVKVIEEYQYKSDKK